MKCKQHISKSFWTGLIISLLILSPVLSQPAKEKVKSDEFVYKAMKWRCIGPFRGGRVTAVAGVVGKPYTYYFGATGGGVWKTEDGGLNYTNVSDGFFKTGSVGAVAVSEWDTNVVYVGMGEAPIRGNVSHGDGVYKSVDAGKTWTHMGLADSYQISRIRIHPRDHDLIYVAALGHVYGPNQERGVFRSKNGGKNWEKILYQSDRAGAIDLILDPTNPRIIYAGFWETGRTPYSLTSGGPGSSLFKSTDGGDNWQDISRNPGLPRGLLGKIGVAASAAKPGRVWAIIEAKDGGVFRSDDWGETWRLMNNERRLRQRAWYYTRIYADPQDPETVYVLNTGFYCSVDGGRTYTSIRVPHGDNHDLWINPDNPKYMINGNDGGANVSINGGESWTGQDNQPTAQFYHVITDTQFPYWVYGAQQDNSTVRIASRTSGAGIDREDWHSVGGGESGHIAPRYDDPDIVYAGSYGGLITRWDYNTKQQRIISPWPENPMGWGAGDLRYRFQWTAPILVSRFDSNVLYHAAQVLFRSTNEGQSWEVISPDLTTNDKSKQKKSGGPITFDDTSVEYYCTIFALAESYHDPNILWVGSDDGLVHVTIDGGENWKNITPRQMPEWSLISMIETSTFDESSAYLAVDRHELDDFNPYIYKTEDFGKTWKSISSTLPSGTFVRVVREDPKRKGLLYAGTETGVFVSFNDGGTWRSLQLNLPVVPIHDLVVKDNDLVAATHGRSFWILDDLTPLHQIEADTAEQDVFLFKPRDAYRMQGWGWPRPDVGENPPSGSVIYYYFKNQPENKIKLEFMDDDGNVIKSFSSGDSRSDEEGSFSFFGGGQGSALSPEAGMNRFIWDMRYPDAVRVPGAILWAGTTVGPVAVPGTYHVRLTAGENVLEQTWEWKKDPRISAAQEDLQEQFDFLTEIREKVSQVNKNIVKLRDIKDQINSLVDKLKGQEKHEQIAGPASELIKKLESIEDVLIQSKSKSGQDPLNYPIMLDNKLAALTYVVSSADGRPTDQSYKVFEYLKDQVDEQIQKLKEIIRTEVAAFNDLIESAGIPAVLIIKK